jgi:hypothetical protein
VIKYGILVTDGPNEYTNVKEYARLVKDHGFLQSCNNIQQRHYLQKLLVKVTPKKVVILSSYKSMRCINRFQSPTDRINDGGPKIL